MQRFRFKVVIGAEVNVYTRTLEIDQGAEEAEKNLREIRTLRHCEHDVAGADTTNKQESVNWISS